MIAGWDKALRTMSVGERSIIKVTNPELGYGSEGVPDLIPSGAELEFDIEILESQPPMQNIDFDSIATADNTPVRSSYRYEIDCKSRRYSNRLCTAYCLRHCSRLRATTGFESTEWPRERRA